MSHAICLIIPFKKTIDFINYLLKFIKKGKEDDSSEQAESFAGLEHDTTGFGQSFASSCGSNNILWGLQRHVSVETMLFEYIFKENILFKGIEHVLQTLIFKFSHVCSIFLMKTFDISYCELCLKTFDI